MIDLKTVKLEQGILHYAVMDGEVELGQMTMTKRASQILHDRLSAGDNMKLSFPWAIAGDGSIPGRVILELTKVQ